MKRLEADDGYREIGCLSAALQNEELRDANFVVCTQILCVDLAIVAHFLLACALLQILN